MPSRQHAQQQEPSEGAVAAAIAASVQAISENQRQHPLPRSESASPPNLAQGQPDSELNVDDQPVSPLLSDQVDSSPRPNEDADSESAKPHHQVSPMATPRRDGGVVPDRPLHAASLQNEDWEASILDLKTIRPAPAYVSISGAAQAINDQSLDWGTGNKRDVQFSETAIFSVNSFLDYTLRRLLAHDYPISPKTLRSAATAVLRSKLGNAAITRADEELHELLADNENESDDLDTQSDDQDQEVTIDMDQLWKRTRLRVMVYMRLGDMEDEDEERYVKEEQLIKGDQRRFSQATGLVSWPAAIYLTALMEFVGEQVLKIAAQSAIQRINRTQQDLGQDSLTLIEVLKVDVEKIALSSLLGRTWRIWRRSLYIPRDLQLDELDADNDSEGCFNSGSSQQETSEIHTASSTTIERSNISSQRAKISTNGKVVRRNSLNNLNHPLQIVNSLPSKDKQGPTNRPTFARKRSSSLPIPERAVSPPEHSYVLPGAFPDDVFQIGTVEVLSKKLENPRSSIATSARTAELLARGTEDDIAELDSRKTLAETKNLVLAQSSTRDHDDTQLASDLPSSLNRNSNEGLEVVNDVSGIGGAMIADHREHVPDHAININSADDPFVDLDTSSADRNRKANSALQFTDIDDPEDPDPALSNLPEATSTSPPWRQSSDVGTTVLTSASIRGLEDFDTFGHTHSLAAEPISRREIGPVAIIPASPTELPISNSRPVSPEQHFRDSETSRSRGRASRGVPVRNENFAPYDQRSDQRRSRSVPRPPSRNLSAHRRSGLMAREPRVQTESTRGLAEFLRTTGPRKDQEYAPVLLATSKSVSSLREWRNSYPDGARPSSADRPKVRAGRFAMPLAHASTAQPRIRTHMEPRNPRAETARNSELIDFIRTGPAIEGQHRISRAVAPFRSTMDSDQLQDYGGTVSSLRMANEGSTEPSHANKRRSVSQPRTHDFSDLGRTVQSTHVGQPQPALNNATTYSEPQKRRHRNKDPYAQYYMDDDDDDLMYKEDLIAASASSRSREESLAEFLRNSSPPGEDRTARTRSAINGSHLDPVGSNHAGPARSARSDGSSRAERNEFIDFLNAGPPRDSAPSPGIGSNHYSNSKENRKSRAEVSKRSNSRRSGFFSWMK